MKLKFPRSRSRDSETQPKEMDSSANANKKAGAGLRPLGQLSVTPAYAGMTIAHAFVNLNVIDTCVHAVMAVEPLVAAAKRHLRTASIAAWSSRAKPLPLAT